MTRQKPMTSEPSVDPLPADLLLVTKLQVPRPRPDLVPRARLRARLEAGLAGRLTLLSAPAGFGKTTLVSDWLRHGGTAPGGPERRVAWLALDPGDADPILFLRYLVAALRAIAPDAGSALLRLLDAPNPAPLAALLPVLVNDLARLPEGSLLVLDDYHVLEGAAVHELLRFLVEHQPPQLHLVITTREDPPLPLARLRARRQITEVRAADLRFTPEEARTFLQEVMGLALTPEQVMALEERTEGWIAGLQLAALSLQDQTDVPGALAAFTGSNRYILDYLIEEVLSQQPAAVQQFLVCTSVLDRLCGPLCDAVLGWAAGATSPSQMMLEVLEQANLFLIPLDAERRWWRYHHLFAALLQTRRPGPQAPPRAELHRRAGAWLEAAGLPAEAIGHALAAADWEQITRLISRQAEPLWMRGELATLRRWLGAVPPAVLQAQPRLLLIAAWTAFLDTEGPPASALALLDQAAEAASQTLPAQERTELRGIEAAIRATISLRTDPARAAAWAREALAALPPDARYWRVATQLNLGLAQAEQGDLPAAREQLEAAATLAETSGNYYTALVGVANLARYSAGAGQLREAVAYWRRGIDLAARHGVGLGRQIPHAYVELGQIFYEWDDLAAANAHAEEGLALAQQAGLAGGALLAHLTLAAIRQTQGEFAAAHAALDAAAQEAPATGWAWAGRFVTPQRARLWLAQGDTSQAAAWAATLDQDRGAGVPIQVMILEQIALALVHLAQSRPEAAQAVLTRLAAAVAHSAQHGRLVEIRALQALAARAQGRAAEARSLMEQAVAQAGPGGYIRVFVDLGPALLALLREARARGIAPTYTATLLAHFGDQGTPPGPAAVAGGPPPPTLIEPLTERERAVLRLLAQELSGPEIAVALVVGPSTIKTHLKSIYGKLGAHSRDQALARAREVGLL
jgi:LuxR family maltose regulon positive regulatory protein